MALGIDTEGHEGCLKARGKTIAVLGSGFNDIYPKENIKLFNEIIDNGGLVISEYGLNAPPIGHHFLSRNRIVAALSNGVVLIEAKENSGSITTANHAIKLKRNLFVLPGSVSNLNYRGSNNLLVNGAKCILSAEDVLKEYEEFSGKEIHTNYEKANEENTIEIPEEYKDIYENISNEPKTINQISIELKMPIHILSSKLTLMEMEGLIKSMPGKTFIALF